MQAKDEASRWLGDNPRLAAELGGAIAFAVIAQPPQRIS
jgi:hypothetical protein